MKLLFIFIPLLVSALSAHAKTTFLDKIEASIPEQGIAIKRSEITNLMKESNFDRRKEGIQKTKIFEKKIIEHLALHKAQLEQARKMQIQPSKQEINQAINFAAQSQFPSLSKINAIKSFYKLFAQRGLSKDYVIKKVAEELIVSNISRFYAMKKARTELSEIKNISESLKKNGINNTKYRLGEILISKSNPNSRKTIQTIYNKLKRGEDFKETAIIFSEGYTSIQGGDLGDVTAGSLPKEYLKALNKTKELEITDIIETDTQYIILKAYKIEKQGIFYYKEYKVEQIKLEINPLLDSKSAYKKIQKLHAQVLSDEKKFAEISAQNSNNKLISSKKGDLGWNTVIELKEIDAMYAKTVLRLNTKTISRPFKDEEDNWCILRISDIRENTKKSNDLYKIKAESIIVEREIMEYMRNYKTKMKKSYTIMMH